MWCVREVVCCSAAGTGWLHGSSREWPPSLRHTSTCCCFASSAPAAVGSCSGHGWADVCGGPAVPHVLPGGCCAAAPGWQPDKQDGRRAGTLPALLPRCCTVFVPAAACIHEH